MNVPPLNRCSAGVSLLAVLLLVGGCSSFRTEMGRPIQAKASDFTNGQTRVTEVIHKIGPPLGVSKLPDGFAFLYESTRVSEFQLGVSVNASVLRYFKFVHAWNRLDQQALLLNFDEGGVLRAAGSSKWHDDLGGGNAVQILVAVLSLSDVSKVLSPADAHDWGQFLLEDPPVTLNSSQTLRTGENGLQQRISPDYVGQHALEMAEPKTEKEKKRIKRNYQNPKYQDY